MEYQVTIIGSGRVAHHLTKAFRQAQLVVTTVNSRTLKGLPLECDLYIIAVSDSAINEVSDKIAKVNGIVVHTSGATPIDVLNSHTRRGILYPCLSFSNDVTVEYHTIPFTIEASSPNEEFVIKNIASRISSNIFMLNSQQRAHLHIAAVITNNFCNHLIALANDYLTQHNLPLEILEPLMKQTIEKAFSISPDKAQTGPAIRGDLQTIQHHLSLIDNNNLHEIYSLITNSILKRYNIQKI